MSVQSTFICLQYQSFVLTSLLFFLLGAHRRLGIGSVEEHFRFKAIHKHSEYDHQNLKNDIAVIELRGSVKISGKVYTVCLPRRRPTPGTKCYVTGLSQKKKTNNEASKTNAIALAITAKSMFLLFVTVSLFLFSVSSLH